MVTTGSQNVMMPCKIVFPVESKNYMSMIVMIYELFRKIAFGDEESWWTTSGNKGTWVFVTLKEVRTRVEGDPKPRNLENPKVSCLP